MRIAWHLGNRHLPTQLMDGTLRILQDHVIEDMVSRLGGTIIHRMAPFDPEGGAYGQAARTGTSMGMIMGIRTTTLTAIAIAIPMGTHTRTRTPIRMAITAPETGADIDR
ncbi:hypothetical protein V6L77_11440 [Pannonibacter sp. Pt2-lr]